MPQAVHVVGKAEQQGLADWVARLRPGAREESLRLTAEKMLSILERSDDVSSERRGTSDWRIAPFGTPGAWRDNALAPKRCRMCWWWLRSQTPHPQHHPIGAPWCRHIEQPGRERASHPGPCEPAAQQNLLPHIHDNQPLQPRRRRASPVRMLLQTPVKEGADGSIGEPVPSMRQQWAGSGGAAADARFPAIRDRRYHHPAAVHRLVLVARCPHRNGRDPFAQAEVRLREAPRVARRMRCTAPTTTYLRAGVMIPVDRGLQETCVGCGAAEPAIAAAIDARLSDTSVSTFFHRRLEQHAHGRPRRPC